MVSAPIPRPRRGTASFRRNTSIAALVVSLSIFAFAQQSSSAAHPASVPTSGTQNRSAEAASAETTMPGDYSKEALVVEKLYTRVSEEDDGNGTRQTTARIRILADAGVKSMAVLTFTFTASNQQVDVAYVRVVKPDGSVVVTPDYNIQDLPADVTREAPMYSDIHQKHVAVKGLGVGDILEYQVTLRTFKPDVPGQFWFEYNFDKNLIELDEELDLDVPAGRPVTVTSTDVQPTMTTSGDRKLYHWASSNLARPDPDAPPKSTKNEKPSVQGTTFSSWAQVGAWYASLQKDALVVTPAIQAKADALTKGLASDDEKIQAIFNDVALHIHYVGLEFGIGRYHPHSADDVLSNEYGDCKDKHTLLATLLKAAGIEAWPVLISSNRTLDAATPSPAQFDHVITAVPLSGKLIWMDSTAEIAPVGVLIGELRDKQALAVPFSKPAYLQRTPADLPFPQTTRFEAKGKLSDQGIFEARIDEAYRGDAELVMRAIFRGVPQSQWKELLQNISNNIGFAGDVKDPVISPVEQTSEPLHISYDYTREKFGEWDSRRISPPFPPIGMELAPGVKDTKPADDIDLGSPGQLVYTSSIKLPEGWKLAPERSVTLVEDWAEYHSRYTFDDGVFNAERWYTVKKDKVPLSDWEKYLSFRRAIYDDEMQMASFISSSGGEGLGGFNGFAGPPNQDISDVMSPLRDAIAILTTETSPTKAQLDKADDLADAVMTAVEARSLEIPTDDPRYLFSAKLLGDVWCMQGWTALEEDALDDAETYLRAAWRLSQDQTCGYLLSRVLETKGEKKAAAHLLELAHASDVQTVRTIDPDSSQNLQKQTSDRYEKLTGKALTSTALNHGQYTGSLQAELDKEREIQPFLRTTKLTGSGFFAVSFEEGKPVTATFLGGDKGFASLTSVIEAHPFPPQLPNGSKARLLREVKVICTPYAGCDANFVLPSSIEMPSQKIQVTNASSPEAQPGKKTVRVLNLPIQ